MAINGGGSTTPAVGSHNYPADTVVNIIATPDTGWQFVNWSGEVTNPNSQTTTVTMNVNKMVTANFKQPPIVQAFDVQPRSISAGGQFTISYTVSDQGGSGLKQVELWRTDDPSHLNWPQPPNPINTASISGSSKTGQFQDNPPTSGYYWYGLHVVDNNNLWNEERNSNTGNLPGIYGPIQVTTSPAPTSVPNDIFPDETQAHGELSSGISAMVADSSGIRGDLVVRSYVNAWLSLSATAKNGAIVGSDDVSVSFGVIPPGGTATYHWSFSQVDQSIDVTARYDFDAWLWNTADAVLSLIPGSSALGGGGLVETLNALKGLDAIQKAASELQTIRYDGWASAPGHALSAANKLRELVTNEQQVAALQTILARVGLNVSYDSLKNLLTLTQIYDQLVRIGHTLVFFIVAPDGATVTFKAQYLESAHNPPPPPLPPSVGEGAPNPQLFIDCYNQNGGATILGYPVNKAHRWGNGYIQDFRGGEGHEGVIMHPDGANQAYAVYGSIWSKYLALGGAEGQLGYPTTDETEGPTSSITSARCRYNKFGDGAIAHRKATGTYEAKTVFLGWGVFIKWEELGYGSSALGLPISDERETPQSGAEGFDTRGIICDFEGGHIYWHHRDTGAYADQCFETHGAIDTLYTQMGGTASWLGFPISDEYENDSGYAQSDFETGYITTTDEITYQAFPYNKAPTLSWTGEVNYDNDGLDPESGNSDTNFVYRIKYTDQDGDAPNFVRVHILKGGSDITNSPFTMSKVSGTYESGAIYSHTKSGMSKGADYSYYFEAQDIHSNDATHTPELDAPHVSTNQPPTAYIDSITPNPATQGEDTVHFEGHGTDSDSDGIVAHNWRSRIDGQLNTFGSFDKPASELAAGTHTIYFKVQDDEGLWSSEVTEVLTINPSSSGPEIAYSPSSFSFEASEAGSNPSDKTLIIWNADGGILNWEVNDEAGWLSLVPTSGSSTGEEDCVAVSVDISGLGADTYHATITISASEATNTPQIVPVSLTLVLSEEPSTHTNADPGGPYAASEGAPVLIDGGGSSDPDGEIVLYEWDWNGDEVYDETTTTCTVTHTWNDDYSGVIWLRVTDNQGAQHEASTGIQINNIAPTIESGDDITVNLGDEAVLQGSYTDPGDDSHTITWTFGDGETSSAITPSHIYDNPGQYTATLTVTDDGGEATDTVNVNVLAPTTLKIGLHPSCSIGSPLDIDGELFTPSSIISDAQVLIEYSVTGGDTWNEITMTPTDQEGKYQATWIPPATGSYIIRARYGGEPSKCLREASHQTSLAVTPGEANNVFSVVSNSIITNLAFDSTRKTLSFTITGDPGTSSHTQIIIAKTLIPEIIDLKLHVDGTEVPYTYTSDESRWILSFDYTHSTHDIVLSIQPSINQPPVSLTVQTIEGTLGSQVIFSASGSYDPDGSIVKYSWDYGDSNSGEGAVSSHAYTLPGEFTASLTVTDDQGATSSTLCTVTIEAATGASSRLIIVPPPPVDDEVTAEDLEEMHHLKAISEVNKMDPEDASDVLPDVKPEKRLEIVKGLNITHLTDIVDEMSSGDASETLTGLDPAATSEVLCDLTAEKSGSILVKMEVEESAQIILELEVEAGSEIIEQMAEEDLTQAAIRVEAAVKERIKEESPETQQEILEKLTVTLENVDVESLVKLFVEIANLPETPSTVAELFTVMNETKLITVIETWMDHGNFSELATVINYLKNDTLRFVYDCLTPSTRVTIHYNLSDEVIAALPPTIVPRSDPVLEVVIMPVNYHEYSIDTTVLNMGDLKTEELEIIYEIDGVTKNQTTIPTLTPQGAEESTLEWRPDCEGDYSLVVTLTSETSELNPENCQFSVMISVEFPDLLFELISKPEKILVNEDCCLELTVKNVGAVDVEGFNVDLLINNNATKSYPITGLEANSEESLSILYTPTHTGSLNFEAVIDHENDILERDETNNILQVYVEVENLPQQPINYNLVVAGAVVLASILLILIRRK
ncbi:MAG: PKD domain-containing protein [Candidatus Bathyarchaeota archaeon]|nr:PKD domain-containing protein [Candidatus Bathyarchaeota archaeon]